MIRKDLLIEIAEELEDYCSNESANGTLADFLNYMYLKNSIALTQSRKVGGDHAIVEGRDVPAEDLGKLLLMMNRYAKHYIKIAFEGSLLQTPEDFTYLMVLFSYDKLLQTDLIRKNAMEKASGNEVIKRLMRLGLIESAAKVDDKRAKPISISNAGRAELFKVLPKMKTVGNILIGNLSAEERDLLIILLSKLDHHHHALMDKKDVSELDHYLHRDSD
ncbi:MarR family winged helix-turn-helix transcriptional regulator [Sphingobacterium sp. JUb56]|uniref:MarR family winged helix-turn-helix transcriptional regulator n=1 Tax=Sphingobacterium sp. JUb56 TaxID=2587145 RepID=UPI00161805C4|nr:MarR family winged helix-turn-helix transcriptional regulator [Sphingobacterium sp. JUb56]MBB2951055.1 DNA-binding MarR family transcriptional regulator [Sphingobacterium sp. JUb56]